MTLDEILVLIVGTVGIGFIYWFFLMKKEEIATIVKDHIDILVKGGYNPSVIEIPKGKTTEITFKREDPSSCLEEVIVPEFKIKKYLPLHQDVTVSVTPKETGEYEFSCGMGMFHGKIIVH